MNFGWATDEATGFEIMDEALEAGINYFDTADVYGGPQSPDMEQGTGPNDRRLSAYHIRKACEDSLRRLQTDHIDLYQMHHVDRLTPWDEIWQAMEQLVREGKVIYVGSSNFAGWDIATAQNVAASRDFLGLAS